MATGLAGRIGNSSYFTASYLGEAAAVPISQQPTPKVSSQWQHGVATTGNSIHLSANYKVATVVVPTSSSLLSTLK